MNTELLKNVVVRVTAKDESQKTTGSGVIVKDKDGIYYVITAEHCIFGKTESRLQAGVIKISVEYKKNNEDSFKTILVDDEFQIYRDISQDIAIVKIGDLNGQTDDLIFCNLDNHEICQNLHFRGFPRWLENDAKTFECKIEEFDTSKFIIKSQEIVDLTLRKDVDDTSFGLSGSGVFEIKNGKLRLLGVVTNLRDKNGTFGHIICSKLDKIFEQFNFEVYPMRGGSLLLQKSKAIEKTAIEEKIKNFKACKNVEFDNLLRKCKILYSEEIADLKAEELLELYFLAQMELYSKSKIDAYILDNFEAAKSRLTKRIFKSFNNRKVENNNQAQDVYQQVIDLFIGFLNVETENKLDGASNETLSDYAVNELLLNCNLNFK